MCGCVGVGDVSVQSTMPADPSHIIVHENVRVDACNEYKIVEYTPTGENFIIYSYYNGNSWGTSIAPMCGGYK